MAHAETIGAIVAHWAERQPDAPVFLEDGKAPLTYRGLNEIMAEVGGILGAAGLSRGKRIGLLAPSGAAFGSALLSICAVATVVPINPNFTAEEMDVHFRDCGVDALVIHAGMDSPARSVADRCSIPVLDLTAADERVAGSVTVLGPPLPGGKEFEPSRPDDILWVLSTSGTTAGKRIVAARHGPRLVNLIRKSASERLGPDDRALVMRPLYYAAGIANILSACVTGGSAVFLPRFESGLFFRYLAEFQPTWFTGGSTFLKEILAEAPAYHGERDAWTIRTIVAPLGPADAALVEPLETLFSARLIESYSCTEAGVISCNRPDEGETKRGTVGRPILCDVRILDPDFRPVTAGTKGEIVISGDAVFEGYENDKTANAQSFVDGWFRTGDEGFLDEDGYLSLTGRIKETINRGGEKVSPVEVDGAAMSLPGVADAATFPVPHPTLGEEVALAVVAAPGVVLHENEVLKQLGEKLSGYKLPRRIVLTDRIPKSDAGKVQRHELFERLGPFAGPGAIATDSEARMPSPLEARLQSIWAEILGIDRVGLDDNFFLLGGDSLQAVELFLRIEKELRCPLPVAALFEAGSVAEMATLIESDQPQGCIVPIQPTGSRPPFFCVHGGSGQVIGFYNLAKRLGRDQPFYGIQAIGWDGVTPPFTRTSDMVAHYLSELRKVQPSGPYYLGGFSFGGRIAVYMANALKASGDEVELLAILDSASSTGKKFVGLGQWLDRHPSRSPLSTMPLALRYGWFRVRKAYDEIYNRGRRRILFRLCERYRRSGRKAPETLCRPDRLSRLIEIEHRNMSPYEGDAIYFAAQPGPKSMSHPDRRDSWGRIIKGNLEIVQLDCLHEQVIQEPHVGTVAERLQRCLEEGRG
ncbi:MAG: non-ribosomal peptide synthetase [Gammaproteobacteria bacterium]|nr:non-ribosomal peptide synthetase [Gammaproteobacteria bacterium]